MSFSRIFVVSDELTRYSLNCSNQLQRFLPVEMTVIHLVLHASLMVWICTFKASFDLDYSAAFRKGLLVYEIPVCD